MQRPDSPSKRQPWNGQRMQSPSTRPPTARWAPRCGQWASSTRGSPSSVRNSTRSRPKAKRACTSPAASSSLRATMNQPLGTGNGKRGPAGPGDVHPAAGIEQQLAVAGHRQPDGQGPGTGRAGRGRGRWRARNSLDVAHAGITSRGSSAWTSATRGPMRSTSGARASTSMPVELGGVEPEHAAGVVLGHVLEPAPHHLAGVGERPFRVGEVAAPQQVADADLLHPVDVLDPRGGRGQEAVAVDVLAGLRRQVLGEGGAQLLGVVAAEVLLVHLGRRGRAATTHRSRRSRSAGPGGARTRRTTAAPTAAGPPTSTPRWRRWPCSRDRARSRPDRTPSGCGARGPAPRWSTTPARSGGRGRPARSSTASAS